MRSISFSTFISAMIGTVPVTALADAKTGAAAEMACKAQDPLGDVKAIRTDNTICLGGGAIVNQSPYVPPAVRRE